MPRAAILAVATACLVQAVWGKVTLPDVGKSMAQLVTEKGYPIEECT